jgi:hypothetical protein
MKLSGGVAKRMEEARIDERKEKCNDDLRSRYKRICE